MLLRRSPAQAIKAVKRKEKTMPAQSALELDEAGPFGVAGALVVISGMGTLCGLNLVALV